MNPVKEAEMKNELEKALDNLACDGELSAFGRILAELNLFSMAPEKSKKDGDEFALAAKAQIWLNGQKLSVVPAFSSHDEAEAFQICPAAKLLGSGPFEINETKGRSLLFSIAARGLSLWLNPNPAGKERLSGGRLFSPPETLSLIDSRTSIQKTDAVAAKSLTSVPAIQELDLSKTRPLGELHDIFHDERPAEISARLARLVERGVIASWASPFDKETKLFEPITAFYLGFESPSARGREFRDWFKRLMTATYFERDNSAKEILALTGENRELKKELEFSESFKQKVKREYLKLKAKMEDERLTASESVKSVLLELEDEKSKRRKDWATIESLYQKVALLENDIRSSEEWPYPTSLGEVLTAAEKLYSSKIVLAPGDNWIEVSDPGMERHQGLISEAVKMVKTLALTIYPMKFNYGSLNQRRFKEDTGLELVMPSSLHSESSTMCTRVVVWHGKKLVCNNYLQSASHNCRLLIHFKLLDDERKILISHLTAFAMSGLFKLVT